MRSHYSAAWYAAPLLLANGEGLVVNTSSFGGEFTCMVPPTAPVRPRWTKWPMIWR